jgi:hypothetical protein
MTARLSVFLGAAILVFAASPAWAQARTPMPFAASTMPPPGAVSPAYTSAGHPDLGRGLRPAACYAGPVSCDLKSTRMSGHPCTCVGEWGVYWGESG